MAKKKQPKTTSDTASYRTFDSSLWKLAYFLGTTEEWYKKRVRILERQVQAARKELPQLEIRMNELLEKYEKPGLSKTEEELVNEISEKLDDLTDIDIFVPMETKRFRQFTELIRILGLIYLVSIFEGYLVDIVREVLLARPELLKSGKQLTAEEVLAQGNRNQIISYLAEKEVEELLYSSFRNVVKYFEDKFKINLNNSEVSADSITEIQATRNIHIHNRGMVNRRFQELVKNNTLRVGTYKSITGKYLADSIKIIDTLVKFIDTEAKTKYLAS